MPSPSSTEPDSAAPRWTEREVELLTVTLDLLHETGYDRLTIDQVAARARASKATVYRRWPTKADLVIAAVSHSLRHTVLAPNTGSLRGDLMQMAELITRQATALADTLTAILIEVRRNPHLSAVVEQQLLHEKRPITQTILRQAAGRGEIHPSKIDTDLWDILPGYLLFRFLVPGRPVTAETVRALVDEILLPGLTSTPASSGQHT
ncbi:MAG: TetR/AcrR family transcriptional regulator [Pseudonocardiaceae bacterium]